MKKLDLIVAGLFGFPVKVEGGKQVVTATLPSGIADQISAK